MSGLTSTGKLRIGVASAPSASPLFIVKDADGAPRGVTVDLGNALAKELGVQAEFTVAPNTGELTDALEAGRIDVSFMPVDDERQEAHRFRSGLFPGREHLHGDRSLGHQNGQ